jgi:hypothetical protein
MGACFSALLGTEEWRNIADPSGVSIWEPRLSGIKQQSHSTLPVHRVPGHMGPLVPARAPEGRRKHSARSILPHWHVHTVLHLVPGILEISGSHFNTSVGLIFLQCLPLADTMSHCANAELAGKRDQGDGSSPSQSAWCDEIFYHRFGQ